MICSVRSLAINGIQGSGVLAECYISNGLPGFDIVGLPDAAVKEARERVRAAAKNSGLSFPVSRITVNLAPANVKKAGTQYDLPICLSILSALGAVRRPSKHTAFLGELSLDGKLRPIAGVLPMALAAKREEIKFLFVPKENAAEATLARGPEVYGVESLARGRGSSTARRRRCRSRNGSRRKIISCCRTSRTCWARRMSSALWRLLPPVVTMY